LALLGTDDPFRGLDTDGKENADDFRNYVGAKVLLQPNRGHYIVDALPKEDEDVILQFINIPK